MGRPIADLTGKKFGRLIARWPAGIRSRHVIWLCSCRCGKLKLVKGAHLSAGKTGVRSCGCLARDTASALVTKHPPRLRHGHARKGQVSRTFRSWDAMNQRCNNPKSNKYYLYGARGVRICKRWELFENFLTDMGERPLRKTLDRWPDPNGNYEPKNCRWATAYEQTHNRR
jgi:hypothetical protein